MLPHTKPSIPLVVHTKGIILLERRRTSHPYEDPKRSPKARDLVRGKAKAQLQIHTDLPRQICGNVLWRERGVLIVEDIRLQSSGKAYEPDDRSEIQDA